MRYKLILLVGCIVAALFVFGEPVGQNISRDNFYAALASGDMEQINTQLSVVRGSSLKEKDAFEGALLMRKAGLLKKPDEKLKAFKSGRIKLETALLDDNDNTEYHFLRLMIEENAPKVVKYSKDIEKDKEQIQKTYKNVNPVVQKAILDYAKTSKVLHQDDF